MNDSTVTTKCKTYADLLQVLLTTPIERLGDTISIFDSQTGENREVVSIETANKEDNDVLDDGHLYLSIV